MTNEEKYWKTLQTLIKDYCRVVKNGLDERWDKFNIEIYNAETSEAIGGLLARQATLTIQLANTPQIWNPHIAPLILRCMVDAHITLSWILQDPKERAKKYILYGLGQEKLYIEYLKMESKESEEDADELKQIIQGKEFWLNSQRADYLIEVNVGNWAEINTRKMAEEVGRESLYKFVYGPWSSVVHNMWQHVGIFNLKQCRNSLHKHHKVPTVSEFPPDPDYVYNSAKYITMSYEVFDQKYDTKNKTPMPLDWFVEHFNRMHNDERKDKDV